MIKNLKEFKPLINLLKGEKWKFLFYCILLFIIEACSILEGHLNGVAVESISKLDLNKTLIYLGIYFIYELIYCIFHLLSENGLVKLESKLTRKIGYETYSKALNLPAYAYEKMSSGEIINRITSDSDALSFTFRKLIIAVGDVVAAINSEKVKTPLDAEKIISKHKAGDVISITLKDGGKRSVTLGAKK